MFELVISAIMSRLKLVRLYFILVSFAFAIILVRVYIAPDKLLLFLLWNLFLGLIPLFFSSLLLEMNKQSKPSWMCYVMGFVWLIFLPNGPYIFTDIVHLTYGRREYFMLDFITILYFAVLAFISSVISLTDVSVYLKTKMRPLAVNTFMAVICLLCSFGIYMGRDMRFNSWDVILKPDEIFRETLARISHPLSDAHTIMASFILGFILFVSYWFFKKYMLVERKKI